MTSAGTVTVDVSGRDVNLVALLERVDARMRQTNQAGLQLTQTTGGTLTAAQQKAANASIQEAQAMARAAIAVGDNARAHQILTGALGNSAGATDRAVAGLTAQIGRLQSGTTIATQFTDGLKSGLLGIVGPAAAAGVALSALREIPALIQLGAQAEQTRVRFDQLAQQAGTTGEAFTAALRQASGGTIADTNLQLAAMKANLLGVGSSAAQLGPLLAIARDRAQQMGISTEFAFDSLVTGLGRGSRLILDNIGVIVKEGEVNEAYAKSVGKTVAALTDQEKKQALINEVLRQGQATIEATGGAVENTATKIERMNASIDNLKVSLGGLAAEGLGPATEGLARLASGDLNAVSQSFLQATADGNGWLAVLSTIPGMAALNSEELQRLAGATLELQAIQQQQAAATELAAAAYDAARAAALANTNATDQAALAAQQAAAAAAQEAQALAEQTEKSLSAQVQSERLAQFQQLLAQLGGQVAAGQITAAQGALQFANAANIASGEAARLISLQATLAASKGTGIIEGRLERDTAADRAQVGSDKALAAQKVFLSKLNQTHKAAGGARLSDQQKLNNQLLSQQERFADQSEQAEREHGRRLLEIDRDFQARQREQARANEISKREGELGFLKSITASELNATKEGRAEIARINEQFYADFAAAQQAAQEGNLKQSQELVEEARRRAQVEQEYAEQIADARAKKDAGEVQRLEALREKERQLLDEQKKQILEGGDQNVNERDKALADEQRKYEEQQGKIADSADNAAERKVNAALRAGKAVEDENVKLREQEQLYARIGSRGGAPGATGGGTPAPAAPAGAQPLTSEDIAARLQAIVDAIFTSGGTVASATTAAGDKVARAVQTRAVQ